jgi:hypothetical protein
MYNGGKVVAGLAIFAVIITSPFLLNIGRAHEAPQPSLDTPVINQMRDRQCVESAEYMRTEHMQMLNNWRDQVVRNGETFYVSSSGREYTMSLENGCLECHSNQQEFCASCHTYANVDPYCWDCHTDGKGAGQ